MAEKVIEKEVCSECGAEVRNDTVFCYNCGSRVSDDAESGPSSEQNGSTTETNDSTKAALDDLAEKLKAGDEQKEESISKSEQRRRTRVRRRKTRDVVWEPTDDSGKKFVTLLSIGIAVIAFSIVLFIIIFR